MVGTALIFSACNLEDLVDANEANEEAGIKYALLKGTDCDAPARAFNAATDKAVAVNIKEVRNDTRKNASGEKITSNAHSAKYPGIFFIWDSKQKDNGYLVVSECVFDYYKSFVLTSKNSNEFWDFPIALQEGQKAVNGAYIFFIPKAQNNKNINMVFVSEWAQKPVDTKKVHVNLGFIGYYLYDGIVMSTSIHWQNLEDGECIDWDAVDAAYADWIAQGGLAPDRTLWQTSGYASFTFEDYANKCHGDFNIGQLENYYKSYYVDPGYVAPSAPTSVCIVAFEHMSGGQYGYVGMSYTGGSAPVQLFQLAGNDYTYEIVSRLPWPGLNNLAGVQLPVIGSMNPVFNVLGNPNVAGQQTMARAGYYIVEGTPKAGGEKIVINIVITPTVQDQAKLDISIDEYFSCADFDFDYIEPIVVSYERYLAYVEIWNDIFLANGEHSSEIGAILTASGGTAHYQALLACYGAASLPPYYHFDDSKKEEWYDNWADQLEPGLKTVCAELGIDLDEYVKNHKSNI